MSPIDLSKFTDEEYIAPEQHQNQEQQHNYIYEHQQHREQQASDDAMDWLDQATNTTRYFADRAGYVYAKFSASERGWWREFRRGRRLCRRANARDTLFLRFENV